VIALAVVLAALLCGAIALTLVRVRVNVSLQALADGTGVWALAGGGSIGPVAVSGGRAAGGKGTFAVHVFGRKLALKKKEKTKSPSRVARHLLALDPVEATILACDAFARVRIDELKADVRCGSVDPEITGKVAAALAVASGTLAPVARIDTRIDWAAEEDHGEITCSLAASAIPLVMGWDLFKFSLRQIRIWYIDRRRR
jgi:hypothetical protein